MGSCARAPLPASGERSGQAKATAPTRHAGRAVTSLRTPHVIVAAIGAVVRAGDVHGRSDTPGCLAISEPDACCRFRQTVLALYPSSPPPLSPFCVSDISASVQLGQLASRLKKKSARRPARRQKVGPPPTRFALSSPPSPFVPCSSTQMRCLLRCACWHGRG